MKQILSVSFHQVPEIRWMPLVQLEVQSVDIVAGVGCHLLHPNVSAAFCESL